MVEDNKHEIHDEQETAILDIPKEETADQAGLHELNEQPVDEQATDAQTRYTQLPYWRKVAAVFVIFVILVLLFLGGKAIFHKTNQNVGTGGRAPAQPNGETSGGAANGKEGPNSPGTGTSTDKGAVTGSNTGSNPSGAQVGKNGELPNSGPGDVLAIFAGTSLAAAGIHYVVNGRRAKDRG